MKKFDKISFIIVLLYAIFSKKDANSLYFYEKSENHWSEEMGFSSVKRGDTYNRIGLACIGRYICIVDR